MNKDSSEGSVHLDTLAPFLNDSDEVAVAFFSSDLTVDYCNRCFRELFTGTASCRGRIFTDFLSEEERSLFPLEEGEVVSLYISIGKTGRSRSALKCKIQRSSCSYVLVGFLTGANDGEIFSGMTRLANEMTNLSRDLMRKNRELEEAQSKIKTLSGIIPICMHCKEIRDDEGYWNNIEAFISQHSQAEFSHSICSKCEAKYYSDD